MTAQEFLHWCTDISLVVLSVTLGLIVLRIVLGPTLPDRILGLETLTTIGIGFIAAIGVLTGISLYVDVAIALGLVGFLATVALARFVAARGEGEGRSLEDKSGR